VNVNVRELDTLDGKWFARALCLFDELPRSVIRRPDRQVHIKPPGMPRDASTDTPLARTDGMRRADVRGRRAGAGQNQRGDDLADYPGDFVIHVLLHS